MTTVNDNNKIDKFMEYVLKSRLHPTAAYKRIRKDNPPESIQAILRDLELRGDNDALEGYHLLRDQLRNAREELYGS